MGKDIYDLCVQKLLEKENDILTNCVNIPRFGKGDY